MRPPSVQLSLSHVQLFATLWTAACQASLSITSSWSLLKLMSINSVISSSVIPFSSCLQSFSATGYFSMSQFFASGGQSIGVSASVSVLPMNIQDLSSLGWTDWISLQSKGLSSIFPNIIVGGHHHPDIKTRLIPQKRKLQANITDEHRCNCPQQNSNNPNSTIH